MELKVGDKVKVDDKTTVFNTKTGIVVCVEGDTVKIKFDDYSKQHPGVWFSAWQLKVTK